MWETTRREVGRQDVFMLSFLILIRDGAHSQQPLGTEWGQCGRCGVWTPGLSPSSTLYIFLSLKLFHL